MAGFIGIRYRGFKTSNGRRKIVPGPCILDWPALLLSPKVSLQRVSWSRSFFQRLTSVY